MRRALVIFGCLLALVALAATRTEYWSGNVIVGGLIQDTNGVNFLKDAPLTNTVYGRSNGVWVAVTGGGGGGISDAPSDGAPYGRLSATWVDLYAYFAEVAHGHSISGITGLSDALTARALVDHDHDWGAITNAPDFSTNGHTHAAADVVSGVLGTGRLGTGTADSSVFLRGDGTWATVTVDPGNTNGITDAPSNGSFYGRKDAGWVNLAAGDILSGTIATARLGSGTANATKFLRGDQSWQQLTTVDISDITDNGAALVGTIDPAAARVVLELGDSATRDVGTGSGDVAAGNHTHAFADLTSKPTTLSGYGITDGVANSRTISTTNSLTGGGDLSANRTLSLVGDSSSPGNSKYYGTDSGGTRGFHSLPSSSGDAPWAVASFWDPGTASPVDCSIVSGSSSGVHGVYRAEDGLYRVDLLSAQPAGSFKRVAHAVIASGTGIIFETGIISNSTYRTTGTNVFVYVRQAASTSNFETNHPVMLRLFNH